MKSSSREKESIISSHVHTLHRRLLHALNLGSRYLPPIPHSIHSLFHTLSYSILSASLAFVFCSILYLREREKKKSSNDRIVCVCVIRVNVDRHFDEKTNRWKWQCANIEVQKNVLRSMNAFLDSISPPDARAARHTILKVT